MRFGWGKMKTRAVSVSDNLSKLQVGFKRDLVREVKVFVVDAVAFREDWEKNGPAVPGLIPVQAVDRLKKFTQMFDVRARKWCVEWAFPNHDTLFYLSAGDCLSIHRPIHDYYL